MDVQHPAGATSLASGVERGREMERRRGVGVSGARRLVVAFAALVTALFGSQVMAGGPASANASGCSYSNGFTVPYYGVYIPTTGVCVNVLGSGLRATTFSGYFQVKACNFQIILERWDRAGVLRLRNPGPFVNGCHTDTKNHRVSLSNVGLYDGGRACVTLLMAGTYVDRACVYTYS